MDGYETILTPENVEQLTPGQISALEPDESGLPNNVGKLVLGDTWYYVAVVEESEAQTLEESGTLKLRFAKGVSQDLSVELIHVSEAENGRVAVVFRGDTYLSGLTLLRQQSAEVIRQTYTGIRVPKEAVRVRERTVTDEDGTESTVNETGVLLHRGDGGPLQTGGRAVQRRGLCTGPVHAGYCGGGHQVTGGDPAAGRR